MNWHICHKRKLLVLFVFSTYLPMFLLKFQARDHHGFLGISCFWGSGGPSKVYSVVLVGCRIKFLIQRSLPLKIWIKTHGDMLKIRTKKVFFLWQICQFNHDGWLILLKFYWFLNFNSQNLLLVRFLIRPILDPKFPLIVEGSKLAFG